MFPYLGRGGFTDPPLSAGRIQERWKHTMMLKDQKTAIIEANRTHESDTGSPEVRVAILTERIAQLTPYRVTSEVMAMANPGAIFLHCLPSFHDTNTTIGAEKCEQFGITEQEVTDEVFESPASKVFDEAENRMHTIKAVMYATLK